jgi:hypothetical protein
LAQSFKYLLTESSPKQTACEWAMERIVCLG